MPKRFLQLTISGLFFSALTVLAAANPQPNLEQMLQEEGLVGASWSLVSGKDQTSVSAAGLRSAETLEPMTGSTRVHVGSIAKVVLATGVLRLAQQGKLSLDTPVDDLLPQLQFDNPWAPQHPVRVRHLLAHTAGLENLRIWQAFSLKAKANTPLEEAIAPDDAKLPVRTRPGEQYLYSNSGYAILGMVIEEVTGERYEHYLDRELLQPLNMSDSTFTFTSQAGLHTDNRLAMGHFEEGQSQIAVPLYLRPAGQFTTTARDMAALARFLMGDGRIGEEVFIGQELLQATGWPEATAAVKAGLAIGHGLSLAARDRHNVVGLCHPGTTIGFRAMLCLYPQEGKAFFIAFNTDSEVANYEAFNQALIKQLDLRPAPLATANEVDALPDEWKGIYALTTTGIESFAWMDTVFNFVEVDSRQGSLTASPFQDETLTLHPVGENLYRIDDRRTPSHVFFQDAEGRRVFSNGLQSYKQIPTTQMALHWLSLTLGLLGLAYVCVVGSIRLLRGRISTRSPLFPPLLGCLALLVPVPFFFYQSVLQLGDLTLASALLAATTATLPLALLAGLMIQFQRGTWNSWGILDSVAVTSALQWTLLLAAWGMLPMRLWA